MASFQMILTKAYISVWNTGKAVLNFSSQIVSPLVVDLFAKGTVRYI